MNTLIAIVAAAFAILLGVLGFQKQKNKRLDEQIAHQKEVIKQHEVKTQILETYVEKNEEVCSQIERIEDQQIQEELQIEQAQTETDVIGLANDIVDCFNAGRLSDNPGTDTD